MFVSKGKINTSNFFPLLHPEKSQEKPQYNVAISPFLGKAPHFALPLPFSRNIFQTSPPFPSILKMSNPPPPILYEGGGGVQTMYVACYQQSKTSSLFPWSLGQYNHVKKKKEKKKMLIICPSAKKVSPLTYMIYSFIHDVQIFPFIFFFKKFFPYFSLFFSSETNITQLLTWPG